jgi:hypothetical protein
LSQKASKSLLARRKVWTQHAAKDGINIKIMKIVFNVLLLLGLGQAVVAGDSESIVVAGMNIGSPNAVVLVRKADYVVVPVTIVSDQKELGPRMSELSEARKLLLKEVKKNGKIQARSGWFSGGSSGGSWSLSYSSPASDAHFQMQLIVPLTGSNDVFQVVQELKQFVDGLKPGGKASYTVSAATITVANPENYRTELISKITSDLRPLHQGKITVSGLENPVLVRPINDQEVELSLPYRVVLEMPLQ